MRRKSERTPHYHHHLDFNPEEETTLDAATAITKNGIKATIIKGLEKLLETEA